MSDEALEGLPGPDELFATKYRLISRLGRGGMGEVWLAQDTRLGRRVALKLMRAAAAREREWQARFLREAQAAASLNSPHVVQIYEHGIDPARELPFIAMELMEGVSLRQRLDQVQRLSPEETALVIAHVARALKLSHAAGIVHRDLKPDNLFLVKNDDELLVKVLDFGIAKSPVQDTSDHSTRTDEVMGTVCYMSPEQLRTSKHVDGRTDLWALGVIAYECLTGRLPFDGTSHTDIALKICAEPPPIPSQVADVPAGFDEWFLEAVSRRLEDRFQSPSALSASLTRICHGQSRVSAPPPDSVVDPQRPSNAPGNTLPMSGAVEVEPHSHTALDLPLVKRTPSGWILAATAGVAAVGVLGTLFFSRNEAPAVQGLATAEHALPVGRAESEEPSKEADPIAHASSVPSVSIEAAPQNTLATIQTAETPAGQAVRRAVPRRAGETLPAPTPSVPTPPPHPTKPRIEDLIDERP